MTRLTDAELAELERRLARHEATQHPHEEHTAAALEYHDALFEHGANLIRELRALRKVREAAESLREARAEEQGCNDADAREVAAIDALFAALYEARGEQ